jgi:hypothetical protein
LARGTWPNRDLLLVPVGASTALAAQAAWLAGKSGVEIHVTPSASKPKQAWAYVGGAWNRTQAQGPNARVMQTVLERAVPRPSTPMSEAPTERMDIGPAITNPAPAAPGRQASTAPTAPAPSAWQPFADRCAGLQGAVACAVFDTGSLRTLAHGGPIIHAARLVKQGATLLTQMHVSARALGLDSAPTEAVITTGTHHLLLRQIHGHERVAVHVMLLADQTTPSQARADLDRIAPPAQ